MDATKGIRIIKCVCLISSVSFSISEAELCRNVLRMFQSLEKVNNRTVKTFTQGMCWISRPAYTNFTFFFLPVKKN